MHQHNETNKTKHYNTNAYVYLQTWDNMKTAKTKREQRTFNETMHKRNATKTQRPTAQAAYVYIHTWTSINTSEYNTRTQERQGNRCTKTMKRQTQTTTTKTCVYTHMGQHKTPQKQYENIAKLIH